MEPPNMTESWRSRYMKCGLMVNFSISGIRVCERTDELTVNRECQWSIGWSLCLAEASFTQQKAHILSIQFRLFGCSSFAYGTLTCEQARRIGLHGRTYGNLGQEIVHEREMSAASSWISNADAVTSFTANTFSAKGRSNWRRAEHWRRRWWRGRQPRARIENATVRAGHRHGTITLLRGSQLIRIGLGRPNSGTGCMIEEGCGTGRRLIVLYAVGARKSRYGSWKNGRERCSSTVKRHAARVLLGQVVASSWYVLWFGRFVLHYDHCFDTDKRFLFNDNRFG